MINEYIPPLGIKYYEDFNKEQVDMACFFAVGNKDWQLVNFLLSSPKLSKHANIHGVENGAFRFALTCPDNDILEYLIFNLNIKKTKEIEKILSLTNDNKSKLAISLFETRELNKELPTKHIEVKSNKL